MFEFAERDGLFYPLVDGAIGSVKTKDIGKYGHLWINFMEEAYPESCRSLVRFGLLEEKAVSVNEEAYELLCGMEDKLLKISKQNGIIKLIFRTEGQANTVMYIYSQIYITVFYYK